MKILSIVAVLIFSVISSVSSSAQEIKHEIYYSKLYCLSMGGKPSKLKSGRFVDCETEFAAIEFDWATKKKVYECFGQALYYAYELEKLPVCALLIRDDDGFMVLHEAVQIGNKYGIKIKAYDIRVQVK